MESCLTAFNNEHLKPRVFSLEKIDKYLKVGEISPRVMDDPGKRSKRANILMQILIRRILIVIYPRLNSFSRRPRREPEGFNVTHISLITDLIGEFPEEALRWQFKLRDEARILTQ